MAKFEVLSALEVKNAPQGRYCDGAGLWLTVGRGGIRYWTFRFIYRGKRREMGLGGFPGVTLKNARKIAQEKRDILADGKDPIELARAERRKTNPTFSDCAERFIEMNKAGWSNPKHAQQWVNTLKVYAGPVIGKIPVDQIETADIMKILTPIWTTKPETAARLRGRIERVLSWAAVQKFRGRENPAQWKGHLDALLPARSKVQAVKHHKALPWAEVPGFMRDLRKRGGTGTAALEFAILTAARSGEVRGAVWAEIDLTTKMWTVPGGRMKVGQEHRVPLSDQAVKLLGGLYRFEGSDLVFPSVRGRELSDATISAVCRRMDVDAVPHGFRSSFKDWASESTSYANEVSEMALAHTIGNKAEAAYRRGDLLEKRRKMMQAWADYCDKIPAKSAEVTPIGVAK